MNNVGLRILGGDTTDALISSALSHLRNNIDIYSNSWGPADYGFIVDGPSYLTKWALRQGATRVLALLTHELNII